MSWRPGAEWLPAFVRLTGVAAGVQAPAVPALLPDQGAQRDTYGAVGAARHARNRRWAAVGC